MGNVTIKLWAKTGYNSKNVPSSASNLPIPDKTMTNYEYLNSCERVATLRLQESGVNWYQYDYVCISGKTLGFYDECYYWVSSYTMLTGTEVEYTLVPDWITTIGLDVISNSIEHGFVCRIPLSEAELRTDGGLNIIPDSIFTPSQPLKIVESHDTVDDMRGGGPYSDDQIIVVSTVDLADPDRISVNFTGGGTVATPTAPTVSGKSRVTMSDIGYYVPGVGLYDYSDATDSEETTVMGSTLQMIWGLNLGDCIRGMYIIPGQLIDYLGMTFNRTEDDPLFINLACPKKEWNLSISSIYSGVDNEIIKQCLIKFGSLFIASEGSGDALSFNLDDVIYSGDTLLSAVYIEESADMSPGGKTYMKPKWYQGKRNLYFKNTVAGYPWLNQPWIATGSAGYEVSQGIQYQINQNALTKQSNNYASNNMATEVNYALAQRNIQNQTNQDISNAIANIGSSFVTGMTSGDNLSVAGGVGGVIGSVGTNALNAYTNATYSQIAAQNQYSASLLANGYQNQYAMQNIEADNSLALAQINIANATTAPTLMFPRDAGITNFINNGFYVAIIGLSDIDIANFERFTEFNGVQVNMPFMPSNETVYGFRMPTEDRPYSFYQFTEVKWAKKSDTNVGIPTVIANEIEQQLYNGIRICYN